MTRLASISSSGTKRKNTRDCKRRLSSSGLEVNSSDLKSKLEEKEIDVCPQEVQFLEFFA